MEQKLCTSEGLFPSYSLLSLFSVLCVSLSLSRNFCTLSIFLACFRCEPEHLCHIFYFYFIWTQ